MQMKGLLLMVLCLIFWGACSTNPSKQFSLSEVDNGSTIELRVGDKVKLNLAGNPTTGYNWTVERLDFSILKQTGEPEFKQTSENQNRLGAGGLIIYNFEAIQKGTTSLRMIYHRPWEKDVPPVGTFEVTIIVR